MNEFSFSDSRKFLSGGIWYPNAANFPALKFLLHQDDLTSLATAWVDRIAGCSVAASGGFTKGANGVYGTVNAGANTTGALPVIGDKYPLLVWVGRQLTGGSNFCSLGDTATAGGLDLNGGSSGTGYASFDVTNYIGYAGAAGATYPQDGCAAIYCDTDTTTANGQVSRFLVDAANTFSATINKSGVDGGTGIGTGSWPAFATNRVSIPAGTTGGVKMLALLNFTNEQPIADLLTACRWMAANPGKIYPGFAGKT